jgi:hypothetical protein
LFFFISLVGSSSGPPETVGSGSSRKRKGFTTAISYNGLK